MGGSLPLPLQIKITKVLGYFYGIPSKNYYESGYFCVFFRSLVDCYRMLEITLDTPLAQPNGLCHNWAYGQAAISLSDCCRTSLPLALDFSLCVHH